MSKSPKDVSTTKRPSFERLVVLRNPYSTRAKDEMGLVDTLKSHFELPDITEIKLEGKPGDWLRPARKYKLLGSKTLLAVIAGDGTMNGVATALLTEPGLSAEERKTVLLPLWGGNANDLARMLNGMPGRARVDQLMRRGKVVAVHPIEFELSRRFKTVQRLALCYASFGASAAVANAINESSFRRVTLRTWPPLRFIRELMLVVRTLSRAPRFRISDGPDGRTRRLFERVYVNGSRLAKVERISLKLTDKHFYETSVTRMRLGALFSRALELSDRRFAHKVAETSSTFVVQSDVLAQFDGEDMAIKRKTTVTARVYNKPFYALSLRMK